VRRRGDGKGALLSKNSRHYIDVFVRDTKVEKRAYQSLSTIHTGLEADDEHMGVNVSEAWR
jgi:hypothetical protein